MTNWGIQQLEISTNIENIQHNMFRMSLFANWRYAYKVYKTSKCLFLPIDDTHIRYTVFQNYKSTKEITLDDNINFCV